MRQLRLAVLALLKENVLRWFFFIELTALFVLANILTGTIQNSSILSKPFSELLSKEGYMLSGITSLMAEDPNAYESRKKEVLSECTGLAEVSVLINDRGSIILRGYPEEYIHLRLPLSRGRWAKNSEEAVVTVDSGCRIGDYIEEDGKSYRVVGILTANTYSLEMNTMGVGMTAADFYLPYGGTAQEGMGPFAYIPFSDEDISSAKENGWFQSGFPLYVYKEGTDSAEIESDRKLLGEIFECTGLDEIRENTERYNKDNLLKFKQLFFFSSVMVIIGFLSGIVMRLDRQRHDMEVYRLCGGSKRQCMGISIGQDLILLVISAAAAMIIFRFLPMFMPAMSFMRTAWDYIVPSVMIMAFVLLDFAAVSIFLAKRRD